MDHIFCIRYCWDPQIKPTLNEIYCNCRYRPKPNELEQDVFLKNVMRLYTRIILLNTQHLCAFSFETGIIKFAWWRVDCKHNVQTEVHSLFQILKKEG
jgi:hypothetical protein